MAATEPITFDELLQAMEAAGGGAEGFTVAELCERQHIGCVRARNIVRDAIRRGELRPARKWITDISGMRKPVPSYVFVRQEPTARNATKRRSGLMAAAAFPKA